MRRSTSLALYSLLLAAAVLALPSCEGGPSTSDDDLKRVTTQELREMLADRGGGQTVLVDPRPAARFAQGHLPGAVNIPLPQIGEHHPALASANRIAVYGGGSADALSSAAVKKMMALGYKNVVDYRGGVERWRADGGEVVVEPGAATRPAAGGANGDERVP